MFWFKENDYWHKGSNLRLSLSPEALDTCGKCVSWCDVLRCMHHRLLLSQSLGLVAWEHGVINTVVALSLTFLLNGCHLISSVLQSWVNDLWPTESQRASHASLLLSSQHQTGRRFPKYSQCFFYFYEKKNNKMVFVIVLNMKMQKVKL